MELLPIQEHLEDNPQFVNNALCQESLYQSIGFYKQVGFQPPWICYYVQQDDALVGCAAYKGAPRDGTIEIAYGTFEPYQNKGLGSAICKLLTETALQEDPTVKVTARTLPEENFSTKILKRNGYVLCGTVHDPEDGPVWEWVYQNPAQ